MAFIELNKKINWDEPPTKIIINTKFIVKVLPATTIGTHITFREGGVTVEDTYETVRDLIWRSK